MRLTFVFHVAVGKNRTGHYTILSPTGLLFGGGLLEDATISTELLHLNLFGAAFSATCKFALNTDHQLDMNLMDSQCPSARTEDSYGGRSSQSSRPSCFSPGDQSSCGGTDNERLSMELDAYMDMELFSTDGGDDEDDDLYIAAMIEDRESSLSAFSCSSMGEGEVYDNTSAITISPNRTAMAILAIKNVVDNMSGHGPSTSGSSSGGFYTSAFSSPPMSMRLEEFK
jgi:hypothetical protein